MARLARERGISIVEDAANAVGTKYQGRLIGGTGSLACFSFYVTKNLATGEGGMITLDDDRLADRLRVLSLHGLDADAWKRYIAPDQQHYEVVVPGFKYNLTDLAAALGLVQLERAEEMRLGRERVALRYREAFAAAGLDDVVELPRFPRADEVHAWHLFPVRLRAGGSAVGRDELIARLAEEGIGTSVHFIPLHLHPYYRRRFGYSESDLPTAAEQYRRVISLPIYPDLTDAQVDRVVSTIGRILGQPTAAAVGGSAAAATRTP